MWVGPCKWVVCLKHSRGLNRDSYKHTTLFHKHAHPLQGTRCNESCPTMSLLACVYEMMDVLSWVLKRILRPGRTSYKPMGKYVHLPSSQNGEIFAERFCTIYKDICKEGWLQAKNYNWWFRLSGLREGRLWQTDSLVLCHVTLC